MPLSHFLPFLPLHPSGSFPLPTRLPSSLHPLPISPCTAVSSSSTPPRLLPRRLLQPVAPISILPRLLTSRFPLAVAPSSTLGQLLPPRRGLLPTPRRRRSRSGASRASEREGARPPRPRAHPELPPPATSPQRPRPPLDEGREGGGGAAAGGSARGGLLPAWRSGPAFLGWPLVAALVIKKACFSGGSLGLSSRMTSQ